MRITPDTNFFISATQWNYSVAHKLFIKLIEKDVQIFTTRDILDEFSKVLVRDFEYTIEEIDAILERLLLVVTLIDTTSKLDVVKEDPEDNKIIECAIDSKSDYIITYDAHLLKIEQFQNVKKPAGFLTRQKLYSIFARIKIVKPEDFIGLHKEFR